MRAIARLLLLAVLLGPSTAVAEPSTAMDVVYQLYERKTAADRAERWEEMSLDVIARDYFTSDLSATLAAAERTAAAEGYPLIGFDILYNAQDYGDDMLDLAKYVFKSAGGADGGIDVTVVVPAFVPPGEDVPSNTLIFRMRPEGGTWKIDDIDYGEGSTLRGALIPPP